MGGLSMRGDYTLRMYAWSAREGTMYRGTIYEGDYTRKLYAWSAREGTMYGAGLSMRGTIYEGNYTLRMYTWGAREGTLYVWGRLSMRGTIYKGGLYKEVVCMEWQKGWGMGGTIHGALRY